MIITNNEEALRVKCEDVKPEEVGELVELLERELEHSGKLGRFGIGLAAPQIGLAKNIAIVRIDHENKLNLINTKIIRAYDKAIFRSEGCLSFPGRVEDTERHQELHIQNNIGDIKQGYITTGLLAVCSAHEIDHLHSILLSDRAIKQKVKMPPNAPCFCGSNIKFKKCHYLKQ